MDLEEEFDKLVQEMRNKVQEKFNTGELTRSEAEQLQNMISSRVAGGWDNSGCYSDNMSSDYDDGWSPSMVC